MDITITPTRLNGTISAIPSKSQAHRLLICAAFADKETVLLCSETNQDIEATVNCLKSLGAKIDRTSDGYHISPITLVPQSATLYCGESGSTLRFMLPIVGALGVDGTFILEGRLPARPLSPLWEELEDHGCTLSRPSKNSIRCTGKLQPGSFNIDGGVSSQFITGLLFAMALLPGTSTLNVCGELESYSYVKLTQKVLQLFQVNSNNYTVNKQAFVSPIQYTVEGDWSNAAFFLAANVLGNNIQVIGLDPNSTQGDRIVPNLLTRLRNNVEIDASDIPDLVPILAVVSGSQKGATFKNIRRLRLKESDRVASVCKMIQQLGGKAEADENILRVFPGQYHSCTINSVGDHRIAMAAAIAATIADGPITIIDAHCVAKSYPSFWEEYRRLGGNYEQYIR